MSVKPWVYICALALVFLACSDTDDLEVNDETQSSLTDIPEGFPQIEYPKDNAFSMARWELGKRLFFDPILSSDSSISCGSCHLPNHAFSDVVALSTGAENQPGTRNSPTLANVAYLPYFTREGGVPTLEMQVLVPIQEHNEFNSNIVLIAEKLNQNASYVSEALKAYDRIPDAFVITKALANFERTLISGNSFYDQYNRGDLDALTESQRRGMELFFGDKTNCASCHGGFNFTESELLNNGLYEIYADNGRYRLTGNPNDIGVFKVPTLRNIELTAPYMHDGSVETLEGVLAHYISGGSGHVNQSEQIEPLTLSDTEKTDLISFLESLTDVDFAANPNFIKHN